MNRLSREIICIFSKTKVNKPAGWTHQWHYAFKINGNNQKSCFFSVWAAGDIISECCYQWVSLHVAPSHQSLQSYHHSERSSSDWRPSDSHHCWFAKLLFPLSFNFLLSHVERLKNEAHKVLLSCSDRLVTNSLALSEFLLSGGNVSQWQIVSVVDFHQQFLVLSHVSVLLQDQRPVCVVLCFFLLNGPVSVCPLSTQC